MALMLYRVAGAAFAAGAGYQGYLWALPMLEVVVDPKEMRSFARRQLHKFAAWILDSTADREPEAAKNRPLTSDRAATDPESSAGTTWEFPNMSSSLARGTLQLAQQNAWLLAFPGLAILWACSQAMQILAGTCWAIRAAVHLIWQAGSLAYRVASWPLQFLKQACERRDALYQDEGILRCAGVCGCGLPSSRSRYHKAHQLDATCLCDVCINVALRPPSLPRGAEYVLVPDEHLTEAQLKCRPRRGYNWAEPERLMQSGVYQGVPYTAMLADVNYMNTVHRQGTRAGMLAAGSYLNFVRRHEEAVAAGSGA